MRRLLTCVLCGHKTAGHGINTVVVVEEGVSRAICDDCLEKNLGFTPVDVDVEEEE